MRKIIAAIFITLGLAGGVAAAVVPAVASAPVAAAHGMYYYE